MNKKNLDINIFKEEASKFSKIENNCNESSLYGITDGKAVGTYLEHKFKNYLDSKYDYLSGNSASGIDFPGLNIDMKVTSIRQPQSSCPYKSARQKIFGLGYNLLIFVYNKTDDIKTQTAKLNIKNTIFINKEQTADYQTTRGILDIVKNEGNEEDLVAFMQDKNLPVDEIEAFSIAKEILKTKPSQGYLTISNALQWRLQYSRVIEKADKINGIQELNK